MNDEKIRVKMAEFKIASSPGVLITVGLGSCVGVAIYDTLRKIGGLIHIMLPENKRGSKKAKYANTGIPLLINKMEEMGASRYHMLAKIAGGAQMFNVSSNGKIGVGERNIKAVRQILQKEKIKLQGEEVGQNYGRTLKFYTKDGRVLVTSYKQKDIIL